MGERFAVYRYEINQAEAETETRYSFAPVEGVGYGGRGTPAGGHPEDEAPATPALPAGHVEAPAGTMVATVEPPVLEIPGHGRVDLSAIIGATEGDASGSEPLLRWLPA